MSLKTVPTQKYGLIQKVKSTAIKSATAAGLKRPALAAFVGDGDDDDDDGNGGEEGGKLVSSGRGSANANKRTGIARTNEMLMSRQQQQIVPAAYDGVDAAIYDYDGEYDSFKASTTTDAKVQKSSSSATAQAEAKAQYIGSMLATAKVREKEKDRIFERKLLKDRKEEDELYPDQPKFITSAYKETLREKEKWDQEDRMTEELEKRLDVRKQGMQGFYQNLMTKNIAVGGNIETSAVSAYTAGSARQHMMTAATAAHGAPGAHARATGASVERSDEGRSAADPSSSASSSTSSSYSSTADNAAAAAKEKADVAERERNQQERAQEEQERAKHEKISAARERYLARRNLASGFA